MKREKRKPTVIPVPVAIYRTVVVLFIGSTCDEIVATGAMNGIDKKHFTEGWRRDVRQLMDETQTKAFTILFGDDNRDVLIWLRERPRTATEYTHLYHEIAHAVDFIAHATDEKNLWYGNNGMSEPRAYLFGYLATAFNRALWPSSTA